MPAAIKVFVLLLAASSAVTNANAIARASKAIASVDVPPPTSLDAPAPQRADAAAQAQSLYDAKRYQDLLDAYPESPDNPPQLELYRGLAAAQLQRWDDARDAFEHGLDRDPQQPRLLQELAGVEYKQKQLDLAKSHLRRAGALQPHDNYTNDFLATIYFEENNLEAALKYWNRSGKPVLSDLTYRGTDGLDPILLDRAFDFSLGSEWRWDQFLAARARLDNTNAFSTMRFQLAEQSNGKFQLTYDANARNFWGGSKLEWIASLLRGLPYQTIFPEFYNLDHDALNWISFLRWDDQKRRVHAELSAPLWKNPAWKYRFYFNARDENWNLAGTFLPALPASSAPAWLNLERVTAGAEFRAVVNGRWSWSEAIEFTDRRVRDVQAIPLAAGAFLTGGPAISDRFEIDRSLIRLPEYRFTLDSSATAEVGTFFDRPLGRYARIAGDLHTGWNPRARSDDYGVRVQLRGGRTFGEVPFDELFMLGFDKDNDLWMRGHPDLREGQKGGAPLGRNYVLINGDFTKDLHSWSLLSLAIGPFVDSGKISDPSGFFGAPKWLWDTGVQGKIRVFGNFDVVLGYGKDVRGGTNSFFSSVSF